jgi:hypothetical protein
MLHKSDELQENIVSNISGKERSTERNILTRATSLPFSRRELYIQVSDRFDARTKRVL